jgi:predicted dehydrogenase
VADRRVAPVFAATDDADLIAFCSRDLSKAGAFRERHGAKRAYDSLDRLLADDAVHIIYIATPNALHAEQASRCLLAGRHVLVDKPMATNAKAAETMIEAARDSGRLLGVMQQQRFHPANVHLMRLRDEGRLGKLNVLRVQIAMWCPPGDNWRGVPELSGGGVAIDLAPHALDLMLEVGGEIKRVEAQMRNLQFHGKVEDFCSARLEFAGGAMGLLDLSHCAHHYGGRLEAFGSEATFAADGAMQQAGAYYTWFRRGETIEPMRREVSSINCYQEAIEDFTDAVLHDGDPSISGADGLKVCRVIDAMYASARSGRPVDVATP